MRKITILLSMMLLASFGFAQTAELFAPTHGKEKQTIQKPSVKAEGDVIWLVTFDEEEPVWTFGQLAGTKSWFVTDTTPDWGYTNANYQGGAVPVPPFWLFMGWKYVHDYSNSGGLWAGVDGISDLLGVGGNTPQVCNTYIQFDNIDMTGVMNPKLSMFQNYKALNEAFAYIDFSIDGGTTWTEVEVNEEVEGNSYGPLLFEKVVTAYIANQPDVSIRLRWQTTTNAIGGYGYGWQVDDISIVDNPNNDLKLSKAVMNFFSYYDEYWHVSSHYGMIPNEQFASEFSVMVFNGIVENMGNNAVTPQFSVKIINPQEDVIYDEIVVGDVDVATGEVDTLNLLTPEFMLPEGFTSGLYTVVYNMFAEGVEDFNEADNADTTYFFVTDVTFARDLTNMTASTGPATWLDGGVDGEMMGTQYMFMYETEVVNMEVFIHENTTPGTAIIGHVIELISETEYIDLTTTALFDITEEHLGTWVTLDFSDQCLITLDGYDAKEVLFAVEFYYNGVDNDIWIGYDPRVKSSLYGQMWYLLQGSSAMQWRYISNWSRGGLGIRAITIDDDLVSVESVATSGISIYPNPSNGLVNINNVEGANVQVLNIMGQVVASIENASVNNTIDMSAFANGTYMVRVVNGAEVSTHKINISK